MTSTRPKNSNNRKTPTQENREKQTNEEIVKKNIVYTFTPKEKKS